LDAIVGWLERRYELHIARLNIISKKRRASLTTKPCTYRNPLPLEQGYYIKLARLWFNEVTMPL
jgi:hypothetical protein